MKPSSIKNLYYITHVENIPSIIEHGIMAHDLVEREGINYTPVYDSQIVANRRDKKAPNNQSLWTFANLYFQPRNPMMYRVIHEKDKDNIAVIGVRRDVLNLPGVYVSTGNAASMPSEILPVDQGLKVVERMWSIIRSEWWREEDGSKRKIMAECLVPERVPPDLIDTVYVNKYLTADQVKLDIERFGGNIAVIPEPSMFFQPSWNRRISENITLVQGDMFFSQMQTLTISVNTVGIMGKGLASRAKYQFPDVYIVYQDACRSKKIKPGKPYLYKREAPMDNQLADETILLENLNSTRWFLLFPTKRHWRDDSRIEDIEAGLKWLQEHYQREGIKSLAVPALGCGLGGLEWHDVGPLMCKYLSVIDISVGIYLPREQEIPDEYLKKSFLLSRT
jgi:O-acetyl-ADP-ribose deacetylase (regulator of RNase III)